MNQGWEVVLSKFGWFKAEDEKDCVDDIWLSVAVWTDDAVEMAIKWAESVISVVTFEVSDL